MTNEQNSNIPKQDRPGQSLFISDEIEGNIGSDVQAIMDNGIQEPAQADGATVFVGG